MGSEVLEALGGMLLIEEAEVVEVASLPLMLLAAALPFPKPVAALGVRLVVELVLL